MNARKWLIRLGIVVGTVAATVLVFYLLVRWLGPIDAIAYMVLFLIGAVGLPTAIVLGFAGVWSTMGKVIGKLHILLGQLTFGTGYLVQVDNHWEWCPGTRTRVHVKGAWREIVDGQENLTILGWRPFGIIWYKDEDSLRDARVDPSNLARTGTDGGTNVERANYPEAPPDPTISGMDGQWLVDLKKIVTKGVQKMGDVSLIEKAEEITIRKKARDSRVAGYEPIIGVAIGLILGVATGYVAFGV